ncbi:MAG: N-acetylglucosamine malate deacetylase 1 [Actinomycetota bacterium]|nr:N-acetylglucosamine malate deacetylase 1 [Actinomycetota bacterium]
MVRVVARTKPLIPDAAWPLLTTIRSLAGDGPILATPTFERVLVLAAHPDDETAGCGGLIALLVGAGASVEVAIATSGEGTVGSDRQPAEVARRREAEARRACELLGAASPRFLSHPDGGLPDRVDALADDLRGLLADLNPDAVLLPWFLDGHRDHRAVGTALERAGIDDGVELWGYETWTPLPPNRLVDITKVYERKERALAAYETAHLAFDVSAMLGLNRYRSAHASIGRGYVEGYLAAPAGEWFALASKLGAPT